MGKVERGILVFEYWGLYHFALVLFWGLQLCWYIYICFVISLVADDSILCMFQSLVDAGCFLPFAATKQQCLTLSMPLCTRVSLHVACWEALI